VAAAALECHWCDVLCFSQLEQQEALGVCCPNQGSSNHQQQPAAAPTASTSSHHHHQQPAAALCRNGSSGSGPLAGRVPIDPGGARQAVRKLPRSVPALPGDAGGGRLQALRAAADGGLQRVLAAGGAGGWVAGWAGWVAGSWVGGQLGGGVACWVGRLLGALFNGSRLPVVVSPGSIHACKPNACSPTSIAQPPSSRLNPRPKTKHR